MLLLLYIVSVIFNGEIKANYIFTSSDESRSLRRFQEYQNFSLSGEEPYSKKKGQADYRVCVRECDIDKPRCKAINVLKTGDTFTCKYFSTTAANIEVTPDTIYISKDPPACLAYCEELKFMNLCGKCKCTDICGSKFNHFCDCTIAQSEPKKNCKEIKTSGFKEPAMYNFKTDGVEKFHGFCEEREDLDVLWLTMFRRFKKRVVNGITTKQLTEGFGKPYDEFHWLGLERLYHFTKSNNTILRVEVATFSFHFKWYGEYGNFKVTKKENTYGYTASDFRTNFCLWNGLSTEGKFDDCEKTNAWDGVCADTSPLEVGRIKWGGFVAQRITFLLRHGSLPSTPVLTAEMGVKIESRLLHEFEHFGMDFCISFNLYTKTNMKNPKKHTQILTFLQKIHPPYVLGITNNGGKLSFWHRLRKDLTRIDLRVPPQLNKWINLKFTQMRTSLTGQHKLRVSVNDIVKATITINDELQDLKRFQAFLGRDGTDWILHDGLVQGLFINGKQYL